jgi:hypothetical protein
MKKKENQYYIFNNYFKYFDGFSNIRATNKRTKYNRIS